MATKGYVIMHSFEDSINSGSIDVKIVSEVFESLAEAKRVAMKMAKDYHGEWTDQFKWKTFKNYIDRNTWVVMGKDYRDGKWYETNYSVIPCEITEY